MIKSCETKISELIKFDKKYLKTFSVIGTDEAGRGPLAGPVVAAAVCFKCFNKDVKIVLKYLDDSKKFSSNPKLRKELSEAIRNYTYYSIAECSVEEIQKYNILQASLLAMKRSCDDVIKQIDAENHMILVDGKFIIPKYQYEQKAVIKGDSKSASIAAASILAKVQRDDFMIELSEKFPLYDWHKNKGYGTKAHVEAIREFGITKWHRKSFLSKLLDGEQLGLGI